MTIVLEPHILFTRQVLKSWSLPLVVSSEIDERKFLEPSISFKAVKKNNVASQTSLRLFVRLEYDQVLLMELPERLIRQRNDLCQGKRTALRRW